VVLLALGTPIISRAVADNQVPIATALRECDAALVLDREGGEDGFRQAIETYATDAVLRCQHRDRGRTLVDGRGAGRVGRKTRNVVE